jgi:YbbR domain-containing protein
MANLRWLWRNLSTLLLSFILALIVWASAVLTTDPNQVGPFGPVPIELVGQAPDLLLTNQVPSTAMLTIRAPQSIWNQLQNNPSLVRAWVDLAGLQVGEYTLPVQTQVDRSPVRVTEVDPQEVTVLLEPLVTKEFPVQLNILGETPPGYQAGEPEIDPPNVTVSGPASAVSKVVSVQATLLISGASQTIKSTLPVRALDENGAVVSGVTLTPNEIRVTLPISILGGYKNVAVKVMTTGQVADGYRLTTISVTPPTVTVYSADPQLVNDLPGYVETERVDLSGLTDDTEFNVELELPEGITLVSEPGVLVQVGVAAIEGSLKFTLPVEALGLPPELVAVISPALVDVIVQGPLPLLESLTPASFRLVVDLTNFTEGVYQITPVLDLIPDEVTLQAINPETVEVIITLAPTPTPRPTDGSSGGSPTLTRTPTPTP